VPAFFQRNCWGKYGSYADKLHAQVIVELFKASIVYDVSHHAKHIDRFAICAIAFTLVVVQALKIWRVRFAFG
jgi:hypothetical protein